MGTAEAWGLKSYLVVGSSLARRERPEGMSPHSPNPHWLDLFRPYPIATQTPYLDFHLKSSSLHM